MPIDEHGVAAAGAAILDVAAASGLDARFEAIAAAFRALLGPVELLAFTYSPEALRPTPAGPQLPTIDFREQRLWGTDAVAVDAMRTQYPVWAALDPVPPVAARHTHRAHSFRWDLRGSSAYAAEFIRPIQIERQLVAGLEVFRGRGLAFLVYHCHAREFTPAEQRATELLYDHVLLAVRSQLLHEQLASLAAGIAPARARGALLLSPQGQCIRAEGAARELVASIDLPGGLWASWLLERARELLSTAPSRTVEERVSTLPRRGGGWVEVRLSRLTGAPCGVLALLRSLEPGSREHFAAAAQHAALTPREREVAALAIQGLSNREIALELGLRPGTVGLHLTRAYAKLGVADRQGLRVRLLA